MGNMVFEIIIKPIVWFDLDEIISWYENERKGLGKQFFASFDRRGLLNIFISFKIFIEMADIPLREFYMITNTFSIITDIGFMIAIIIE